MPRTEISRRSWVGALMAWPGLSPVRRSTSAGAHEPMRHPSASVYSSLSAERGLPDGCAQRYVHSRLRFYIFSIFMYLRICGNCAYVTYAAPRTNPANPRLNSVFPFMQAHLLSSEKARLRR